MRGLVVRRGIRTAYVGARQAVAGLMFERRYGVDTEGEIKLDEIGLHEAERERYKPAGVLSLQRILPRREVGGNDVFVDFGSGKGRVVLQAAMYPCRRVVGVELSEWLNDIARENIDRNRPKLRCKDVTLICSDALDFEIPDDMTIAFLNNPFQGSIFSRVVDGLVASVDRTPRTLRIVYGNPIEEETLLRTGRVRRLRQTRGLRPTSEWSRSNSFRLYEMN
jgi:hypothetical protein